WVGQRRMRGRRAPQCPAVAAHPSLPGGNPLPPAREVHAAETGSSGQALQIGCWSSHVVRAGSPTFIAGLNPGPALGRYALAIWPSHERQDWLPAGLAQATHNAHSCVVSARPKKLEVAAPNGGSARVKTG